MVFSRTGVSPAAVIGVVLAGVPMAAFNLWLRPFRRAEGARGGRRRGPAVLACAGRRAPCPGRRQPWRSWPGAGRELPSWPHIQTLRQANFTTTPIKELSLVDPEGQTLCTDLGIALGVRKVVSSQPLTADGGVLIEVISLGDRKETMIRILSQRRRQRGHGGRADAGGVVLPAGVQPRRPLKILHARLMTRDGTLLAENGVAPPGSADDRFTAVVQSECHNLMASVSLLRSTCWPATAICTGLETSSPASLPWRSSASRSSPPHIDAAIRSTSWNALKAGEFIPYYQPIVDITNGRVRGAEVLMRWRKPDGTIVARRLHSARGIERPHPRDDARSVREVRDEMGAPRRSAVPEIGFNLAAGISWTNHRFGRREIFEGRRSG